MPVSAQSGVDENTSEAPKSDLISGRVLTESGQPIANATVYLRSASFSTTQPQRTSTDSTGFFSFSGLEPSLYVVSASAPAYIPPSRDKDNVEPLYYRVGDPVTLPLVRGGVITGTVTTATGEPVVAVSVRVTMIRDGNGESPRFPFQATERLTDDRGFYRLYGLPAGTYLVSAGGRGAVGYMSNAYDTDSPTFAPASSRETAAEVVVRAAEETAGIDIRYRREPGRLVSGTVSLAGQGNFTGTSVNLRRISNGVYELSSFSYMIPGTTGFTFYGVSDGVYDLDAQFSISPNETAVSEPRRIVVKGADVSGIVLAPKPLATIEGRVALEPSIAPECKNKRRPLFEETLVSSLRLQETLPKDQPRLLLFRGGQALADKSGVFLMRNLAPGRYTLNTRFFAKYWYLRGISSASPGSGKTTVDVARNGLSLRNGDRLTNLTVTLAEGAASLRGYIKLQEGKKLQPALMVFLVPAESEAADNPLRFFATTLQAEGKFAFANLSPGSYWPIVRSVASDDSLNSRTLRDIDQKEQRLKLRREAEANKIVLDLKPCQNVTDYELPISRP
jgi:Carboxypeptidase regulatory-like domain